MSAKPSTITYDPEAHILSIRTARTRSVDSDVYGNVVVDYDRRGHPVNIDIMECSLAEFQRTLPVKRHVRTVRRSIQSRRRITA